MTELVNIVIVDDHKIVRDGIKAMFLGHHTYKIIGVVSNADELFAFLKLNEPHICLLDIHLAGQSGLEIAERLKGEFPQIKIIVFTALKDEHLVRKCRELGVVGMLSKESGHDTFLEALERVRTGHTYYAGQFTEQLIKATQGKSDKLASLSERELEFVKVFSRGYSHKEIADRLHISPRTVEVHKKNVMEKLGMDNTVELIKFAIKEGLVEI